MKTAYCTNSIHIWFGILRDKIVGPEVLNGDIFVDLLKNTKELLISQALEDQIYGEMQLNENFSTGWCHNLYVPKS